MEAILNFIFAYPLSLLFLTIIAILSFRHLRVNRKIFNTIFVGMMFLIMLPIMLILMVLVVYSFYNKNATESFVIPLTIIISLLFCLIKSIVPRSDYEGGVVEVLGKSTPEYPTEDTFWNRSAWHMKMDMLAFLGLSVFIFLDYKAIPLIKSFFL